MDDDDDDEERESGRGERSQQKKSLPLEIKLRKDDQYKLLINIHGILVFSLNYIIIIACVCKQCYSFFMEKEV